MKQIVRALAATAAMALCFPSLASAQGGAGGARSRYPAIFGGSTSSTDRQSLDLSAAVGEAYDDNALSTEFTGAFIPPEFQKSASFTDLSADLSYQYRRKTQVNVNGGSDFRYYGDISELVTLNHRLGAELAAPLGRTTSMYLGQGISYSPTSLINLFPRLSEPVAGQDLAPTTQETAASNNPLNPERFYRFSTTLSLSQRIAQRNTLFLISNVNVTRHVKDPTVVATFPDVTTYQVGGQFARQLDRRVGLNLLYSYGKGDYSITSPADQHDVQIGVNYQRPLSPTRKASFDFNVGSTVLNLVEPVTTTPTTPATTDETQPPVVNPTVLATKRRYEVTGSVSMNADLSRAWTAGATFQRGVVYADTLRGPAFQDALTMRTDGFLGRRVDLALQGSYSNGTLFATSTGKDSTFSSYSGDVRVQVGISKMLAAYVDYLHYFYRFDEADALPSSLPTKMKRNGIHAGLTTWVPLLRRR